MVLWVLSLSVLADQQIVFTNVALTEGEHMANAVSAQTIMGAKLTNDLATVEKNLQDECSKVDVVFVQKSVKDNGERGSATSHGHLVCSYRVVYTVVSN